MASYKQTYRQSRYGIIVRVLVTPIIYIHPWISNLVAECFGPRKVNLPVRGRLITTPRG